MDNFYFLTVEDFHEIIAYVEHHGMISLWYPYVLLYLVIFHEGYFHEIADDWLIVARINWEIIYSVYFTKVFKLTTSVLSLFLVCVDQLFFLFLLFILLSYLFAFCSRYGLCNFTISCLKLKYVLSSCRTSKLNLLHNY